MTGVNEMSEPTVTVKPWWQSMNSWGDFAQWVLFALLMAAIIAGVDIAALVDEWAGKVALAASTAALLVQTVGNITRKGEIDPARIVGSLRSETIGKFFDAIKQMRHGTS
jgi:hypothetical protein